MNEQVLCRIAPDGNGVHYQVLQDTAEAAEDFDYEQRAEFIKKLCTPLVEYLQKEWHPHARIIVEWDRVSLIEDTIGIPFAVPD